jgi:hypothetical protein
MKPFSQQIYDADDHAKHKVIAWLAKRGIEAQVNPDDYGIDLIEVNGDRAWEVEVKHSWSGHFFPFQTVHIPTRKLKFAKPHHFFAILNHEHSHALFVKGELAANSAIINKDTSLTRAEDFMQVPRDQTWMMKL